MFNNNGLIIVFKINFCFTHEKWDLEICLKDYSMINIEFKLNYLKKAFK